MNICPNFEKLLSTFGVLVIFLVFTSAEAVAGDGMEAFNRKDYDEAYRVWAANPETAEASYGIGRIVLEGLGSAPRNPDRGMTLITKAAGMNHRPAIVFLADHYEKTGNSTQAIKYLERLSEKKDLHIEQRILALITKSLKGEITASKQYCDSLQTIGKLGGTPKQVELAACAVKGNPSSIGRDDGIGILISAANEAYAKLEYTQANRYWSMIPDQPESLYGLGMMIIDGQGGLTKNVEKGLASLEKASSGGHKQASLYLADYFEKNGNSDKAVSYLKKACDGHDVGCRKKQVEIYSRSNSSLTKEFCESLRDVRPPEGTVNHTNYLTCAFNGTIKDISQAEAGKRLKLQLTKSPTLEGLIKLGPHLLNSASPLYDLQAFEQISWQIDPELKNAELLSIAKSSGINDEMISEMPYFSDEQKLARISASLVSAITGNTKAAKYIGMHYSEAAFRDTSQLAKAKAVLNLLENEKENTEYKKIKLNILRAERNSKFHLSLLNDLVKIDKRDEKFLQPHFQYQYTLLNEFVTQGKPAYTLDMVYQLAQAMNQSESVAIQAQGLPVLQELEKKWSSNPDDYNKSDANKEAKLKGIKSIIDDLNKKGLPLNRGSIEFEKYDRSTRNLLGNSSSSQITNNDNSSQVPPNGREATTVTQKKSKVTAPAEFNAGEYSKFKYECDQNIAPSCTKAAQILLGRNIPDDFRRVSSADRKEAALTLLEKSSALNDLNGTTLLYDTLTSEPTQESKEKANSLLKQQNFVSSTSGKLRKYAQELKFDLIKTPANLLLKKTEIMAICDDVERIKGTDLPDNDGKIASEIVDGLTCKGVRKLQ